VTDAAARSRRARPLFAASAAVASAAPNRSTTPPPTAPYPTRTAPHRPIRRPLARSVVLSLSFIFGNLLRELFEAVVFVFSTRAYRVGDRVRIHPRMDAGDPGDTYTVVGLSLLTTRLLKWDGTHVVRRNADVIRETIVNLNRCTPCTAGLEFRVDMRCASAHNIRRWQRALDALGRERPDVFAPDGLVLTVRGLDDGLKTRLKVLMDMTFAWDTDRVLGALGLVHECLRVATGEDVSGEEEEGKERRGGGGMTFSGLERGMVRSVDDAAWGGGFVVADARLSEWQGAAPVAGGGGAGGGGGGGGRVGGRRRGGPAPTPAPRRPRHAPGPPAGRGPPHRLPASIQRTWDPRRGPTRPVGGRRGGGPHDTASREEKVRSRSC